MPQPNLTELELEMRQTLEAVRDWQGWREDFLPMGVPREVFAAVFNCIAKASGEPTLFRTQAPTRSARAPSNT